MTWPDGAVSDPAGVDGAKDLRQGQGNPDRHVPRQRPGGHHVGHFHAFGVPRHECRTALASWQAVDQMGDSGHSDQFMQSRRLSPDRLLQSQFDQARRASGRVVETELALARQPLASGQPN
jgi:hypothetical protein